MFKNKRTIALIGLAIVVNVANHYYDKHKEAQRAQAWKEFHARFDKSLEEIGHINDDLGERLMTAKFWEQVTNPN